MSFHQSNGIIKLKPTFVPRNPIQHGSESQKGATSLNTGLLSPSSTLPKAMSPISYIQPNKKIKIISNEVLKNSIQHGAESQALKGKSSNLVFPSGKLPSIINNQPNKKPSTTKPSVNSNSNIKPINNNMSKKSVSPTLLPLAKMSPIKPLDLYKFNVNSKDNKELNASSCNKMLPKLPANKTSSDAESPRLLKSSSPATFNQTSESSSELSSSSSSLPGNLNRKSDFIELEIDSPGTSNQASESLFPAESHPSSSSKKGDCTKILLTKICQLTRIGKTLINEFNKRTNSDEEDDIFEFPISTIEALRDFEEQVINKAIRKRMVKLLRRRKSQHSTFTKALRTIISDALSATFNFDGTYGKKKFKELQLCSLLLEAWTNESIDLVQCTKELKRALHNQRNNLKKVKITTALLP